MNINKIKKKNIQKNNCKKNSHKRYHELRNLYNKKHDIFFSCYNK